MIAGTPECSVSPSRLPGGLRFLIGLTTGILLYLYLILRSRSTGAGKSGNREGEETEMATRSLAALHAARSTIKEVVMSGQSVEERLAALGYQLPPVAPPIGNFVKGVVVGNLLFLSGCPPDQPGYVSPKGKVGADVTVEQAYEAARYTGLNLLAAAKSTLGSLDRIRRVVKLLGMVNSAPGFGEQPKVINGCSDLFVQLFGEQGRHARSAVGMGALPNSIPVEIEAIFEVE
jgi:enamine deaminase RidA (YjgF/YER057c/UK114 family)